jgi:hypothetical protein
MRDPMAFSSAQLPTEHFNTRFSEESLAFWVPLLIDCANIKAGQRVLDIGRLWNRWLYACDRGFDIGNSHRDRHF